MTSRTPQEKARDDRALRSQFVKTVNAVSAWLAEGHDIGGIISIDISFSRSPIRAVIHLDSSATVRRLCRTTKQRDDRVSGSPKPRIELLAFEDALR